MFAKISDLWQYWTFFLRVRKQVFHYSVHSRRNILFQSLCVLRSNKFFEVWRLFHSLLVILLRLLPALPNPSPLLVFYSLSLHYCLFTQNQTLTSHRRKYIWRLNASGSGISYLLKDEQEHVHMKPFNSLQTHWPVVKILTSTWCFLISEMEA